ncbi:MAG: ATP-binding protein [Planctomycetota bacterium]|nr:ATP-binding protein [Planctomycetota bacterium]
MFRQRLTTWGAVLAGWCVLATWQYHEYCHEREAAQETLRRQGESVMNALVSGIRSHRRLGQFFEEQVQGVLEELVKSKDVLAAGVASPQGQLLLSSGPIALDGQVSAVSDPSPRPSPRSTGARETEGIEQLHPAPLVGGAESWEPAGYRLVADFRLPAEVSGPGPGGGLGGGRGRGFGARWQAEADKSSSFLPGGQYSAILFLDRTRADEHCRRAAWSRVSVALAGNLLLLCVALVWRMTVRLAAAKAVLEAEARHLRELNQAAAGLAHETRNPLGLIRGWAQRLAQADLGSGEQQQQVQSLVEECDRVTSRINQFLTFARPSEPKIESIDPGRVADELAVLLEPDLDAKQLTLQRAVSGNGERMAVDREMFRQALFNLLQNAVQWSPEGATIEITLQRRHTGRHRIELADRGPGVPVEVAASLFTPYFTTRANGTGLGLAIVRRIAAAHGWEVGYTPRPGGGAIFWVDGIHD